MSGAPKRGERSRARDGSAVDRGARGGDAIHDRDRDHCDHCDLHHVTPAHHVRLLERDVERRRLELRTSTAARVNAITYVRAGGKITAATAASREATSAGASSEAPARRRRRAA